MQNIKLHSVDPLWFDLCEICVNLADFIVNLYIVSFSCIGLHRLYDIYVKLIGLL